MLGHQKLIAPRNDLPLTFYDVKHHKKDTGYIKRSKQKGEAMRANVFFPVFAAFFVVVLFSEPAYAGFLGTVIGTLKSFNAELIILGGVLAVTGFIWALLGIMIGVAGTQQAFKVLIAGVFISAAPLIASALSKGAG